jgi:hypothetical protein
MKKLTPIILTVLFPFLAFSYHVTIKGIVLDSAMRGVAGVEIQIETPPDHPFEFIGMLETGNDGTFELAVSIPDSIPRGLFILKYVTCQVAKKAVRLLYSVEDPEIMVRLSFCPEPTVDRKCRVEIVPRHGDSAIILTAKVHGTRPFEFKWSTGEITQSIRVNDPGEYCVMIIDSTGCESRDCIKLDIANKCKTVIYAHRQHPERIMLIARSEGRMPFSYMWSTGDTASGIYVTEAGEYCVKVVDAAGCISRDCIVVTFDTDSCSVKIERNSSGNLVAIPRGVPPFKFLWNTGDTTRSIPITGLGEYCVVIHDSKGCTSRTCVEIKEQRDSCGVKIVARRIDSSHIELTARVIGRGEISYIWNTGSTDQSIIVIENGTYCVKIQDEANCNARACIDVFIRDHRCTVKIERADDQTLIAVPKGAAPFEFSWSTGETGRSIKITASGEYCVKMLDSGGCTSSDCIKVEIRGRTNALDVSGRADRAAPDVAGSGRTGGVVDVFPNPFTDRILLSKQSELTENSLIDIYRMDGTMIWKENWKLLKGYNEQQIFLGQIPEGLYYLIWKGQNNVHAVRILKR